ncbi:hypothetical protein HPP92_013097 [Vanilla planifolia]|uniref:Uncharacterized protein n=1 Tax=Vanilla planifolia TaxID=51239 RepID=A0A835QMS0_VANPL|nr:hypothetical protein HPP92_013097 [Vanilla planifolia]
MAITAKPEIHLRKAIERRRGGGGRGTIAEEDGDLASERCWKLAMEMQWEERREMEFVPCGRRRRSSPTGVGDGVGTLQEREMESRSDDWRWNPYALRGDGRRRQEPAETFA